MLSQQLMMRAGMIQKVAAGIYSYLPLAFRSIRKFEEIGTHPAATAGRHRLADHDRGPQDSDRYAVGAEQALHRHGGRDVGRESAL